MSRRVGALRTVIRLVAMLLLRGTLAARVGLHLMLAPSQGVSCRVVACPERLGHLFLRPNLPVAWRIVRMLVCG